MRYVIAVKNSVYGAQGAFSAYQLAQEIVERGHEISQIFFWQDGVSNANDFVHPANDEFNLVKAWQEFSQQYNIPLHLCISASQRRGIVDNLTALLPSQRNLADYFVLAGLGEFMQATLEADRVVTL
ncbi:tRNA 2-thiouridine synthesizing protein D [Pasteurella langaaensis DSM 22999]|uniref:tRNA 2-thiouridine synthesizing protein D n=1 Tax=Alitibacter langaaensis DSM 22999 TaxID=1122935 RepID=A0A2U0TGI8_9PAST|nr:sulfurtransferase complex subunit TusD [Pasteurella langaaensis]PVX42687.1 tRNA 2-thiouridine synthesizing protein D [Pasteurella langaaensis DSM 22999]